MSTRSTLGNTSQLMRQLNMSTTSFFFNCIILLSRGVHRMQTSLLFKNFFKIKNEELPSQNLSFYNSKAAQKLIRISTSFSNISNCSFISLMYSECRMEKKIRKMQHCLAEKIRCWFLSHQDWTPPVHPSESTTALFRILNL